MMIHRNCRHFRSDRPCEPHKREGFLCDRCPVYEALDTNILILKFDAVGDVLRTTAILSGIKAAHPRSRITWYTRRVAADLFLNNSHVDEVLYLEDPSSSWRLLSQEFDVVYSLDPSEKAASVASAVKAKRLQGFAVDRFGKTLAGSPSASEWYVMGLNDSLKKANQKSFFEHLYALAGLPGYEAARPEIFLTSEEKQDAEDWRQALGLAGASPVVGINPGAGGRWRYKRWNPEAFAALIDDLLGNTNCRVAMLGGLDDRPIIEDVLSKTRLRDRVIDAGAHSLRKFILHVSHCDVVVCGDTLVLHIATALRKRVVALFGPTSQTEIDLFGRGMKLASEVDCLGCYLSDCSVRPTCMDRLSIDTVRSAVGDQLRALEGGE